MKTNEGEEDIDDVMERGKIKETHHKDDDKDDEEKRNNTGLEMLLGGKERMLKGKTGRSKKRASKRQRKDE